MAEQQADSSPSTGSGRVGLFGAMAIGIGGMVGGGIFAVLGEAVSLAEGGTPVAFLVAGVVALLTSYSYAKLAVRYPSQGGTVVYFDKAFGVDLWTGTLNLMLWLSYLVTIALYASAFGSYGATFFSDPQSALLRHTLISCGILLPAVLNLLDADLVSKAETAVVVLKLAILGVVIASAVPRVDLAKVSPSTWADPLSLVAAGMVIFVAYEGFELIANTAQDVRNPALTLPRAFYGSVFFVVVLYVLVAVVTVSTVDANLIAQAKDYALAEAAKPALGHLGFTMVAVAALLATLSAINATVYGNARLGFTLAKDGELPEFVEKKTWRRPVYGVLLTAGLALLIANLVDLTAIAILGSAGFLIVFATVNAAAVKLSNQTGGNRWISGVGLLACGFALLVLLHHTAQDNPSALWVLAALVLGSLAFEFVYPKLRERRLEL